MHNAPFDKTQGAESFIEIPRWLSASKPEMHNAPFDKTQGAENFKEITTMVERVEARSQRRTMLPSIKTQGAENFKEITTMAELVEARSQMPEKHNAPFDKNSGSGKSDFVF